MRKITGQLIPFVMLHATIITERCFYSTHTDKQFSCFICSPFWTKMIQLLINRFDKMSMYPADMFENFVIVSSRFVFFLQKFHGPSTHM